MSARFSAGFPVWKIMHGVNWKAILIGWGIDTAATTKFMVGLFLFIGIAYAASGNLERLEEVFNSKDILLYLVVFGLFFTVLGGYAAARIAGQREIFHSAMVGVLSELSGIACSRVGSEPAPMDWVTMISYLLTIPVAILGGFVRARRIF